MVSEQPERFFVSEIIREQIFVQYDQELPYSSQVQIADFKERQGAKDYIQVGLGVSSLGFGADSLQMPVQYHVRCR